MIDKDKTIEVLNSLITINNDRIEGYETALNETNDKELKILFAKYVSSSQLAKQNLIQEVQFLGGQEAEGTKISGKFFRAWMDVKAALTNNDRVAILDSCAFGENKALDTYDDIFENDVHHLNEEQLIMILSQKQSLTSDRDHVIALKTAM